MSERDFHLAFSLVNGIGPKTFLLLLEYFKSAEKAWNSSSKELQKAGISEKLIQKFENARNNFNFQKYNELLKLKKASFVAQCDGEYPELLKQIPNPPIVLFTKGDIGILRGSVSTALRSQFDLNESSNASVPADKFHSSSGYVPQKRDLAKTSLRQNAPRAKNSSSIAIVGTRKITNYGSVITKMFASELAMSGFIVVSGLAMGVDAVAAQGAIEANGKTIAVLGNGVDLCFPSSNKNLYDKILAGNGVIISEFPLGQGPTLGSFPSRNRIIAGLSLGVLVTEGALDSGSLITADYAFKFNRKVFAVPGPITSSLSVAPLKLIEKGAKLVTDAKDICNELRIKNYELRTKKDDVNFQNLNKDELKIVKLLENESLSFDEIVRSSRIEPSKLGALLSVMEIKGLVKNIGNGSYVIG
jgi:DNA processing protein